MQHNHIITKRLRRLAVFSVIGLLCFSATGCLIIGAKDGNVSNRVAVIESRLDNLERQYATSSLPQQQYGQSDNSATSTQIAETRAGSRIAPR